MESFCCNQGARCGGARTASGKSNGSDLDHGTVEITTVARTHGLLRLQYRRIWRRSSYESSGLLHYFVVQGVTLYLFEGGGGLEHHKC